MYRVINEGIMPNVDLNKSTLHAFLAISSFVAAPVCEWIASSSVVWLLSNLRWTGASNLRRQQVQAHARCVPGTERQRVGSSDALAHLAGSSD